MSKGQLYVIGHKGSGVLVVRTNPLRVVHISDEDIQAYSTKSSCDGYAKVLDSFSRISAGIGDQALESTVSDSTKPADFAVMFNIDDAHLSASNASNAHNAHNAHNAIVSPIQNVLSKIGPESAESKLLMSAVLSDVSTSTN